VCRSSIGVLESSLATILTRFSKERKIDFCDFTVETEYCLQVSLDYASCQVGDNDDFCERVLLKGAAAHVHVFIIQRMR